MTEKIHKIRARVDIDFYTGIRCKEDEYPNIRQILDERIREKHPYYRDFRITSEEIAHK